MAVISAGRRGLVIAFYFFARLFAVGLFCFSLAELRLGVYNSDMNAKDHPKGECQMKCAYCGVETHTAANCRSRWEGAGNRMRLHCEYCGHFHSHATECCPQTREGQANRQDPDYYDRYVLD